MMAVDERLCEPRSVPEARRDLALESIPQYSAMIWGEQATRTRLTDSDV